MQNIEKLSDLQLKQLIMNELADAGLDHELISLKMRKGNRILVSGEVFDRSEEVLVVETISEIIGRENVVDELEVINDLREHERSCAEPPADGFYDTGVDDGTCDIYKAMEEGIPYILPDSPAAGWEE
jgi:hypothetical protein